MMHTCVTTLETDNYLIRRSPGPEDNLFGGLAGQLAVMTLAFQNQLLDLIHLHFLEAISSNSNKGFVYDATELTRG